VIIIAAMNGTESVNQKTSKTETQDCHKNSQKIDLFDYKILSLVCIGMVEVECVKLSKLKNAWYYAL